MNVDLELAIELADSADELTMRHFRSTDLVIATKPDMSPVTQADRAVEQMVAERLTLSRPDDSLLGEEFGQQGSNPRRRWIVDPIDGTKNYVRGIPVFATLLALEEDRELVVGVVSAPGLARRWYAARGEGAFADGERIYVSDIDRLEDAQICHAGFEYWEKSGRLDGLIELTRHAWRDRGFGDFWQHMLVAEGSVEVALDPEVSLWDLAAVKVVVEEAGGRFTDLAGVATASGGNAISSNGLLHETALALIGDRAGATGGG
ncbi:MAG TPA: inositol monophosphatase family protein [Candidatus Dormibacteraeota bacterium]|jgi:histidinol-phosphatase|nr:inositol monophosphatase family protein [Candidatus Dormibacteraeota bacterium]